MIRTRKRRRQAVREKFLPITRSAVLDRVDGGRPVAGWRARQARRFLRYLDYWRGIPTPCKLIELEQTYEPFSPDSDLMQTRTFSAARAKRHAEAPGGEDGALLEQANFTRIDPARVHIILTKDSPLRAGPAGGSQGLRGDRHLLPRRRQQSPSAGAISSKAYIGWKEVKVPVFQRLFILFKLKPFDERVQEVMQREKVDRKEAEKHRQRLRSMLPPARSTSDFVYMKLFKNMPRSDVEMIFPNTKVRFRLFDKIKFGVTAGSGLGMGAVRHRRRRSRWRAIPIRSPMALAGLGGVAARQASNFINQRNRYMVVMARNLYFHSMADNRGVMTLLADRAAEEDIKEEMLLYGVLASARPMHAS